MANKTDGFNIRLTPEDKERMRQVAAALDIPIGTLARYAIRRYILNVKLDDDMKQSVFDDDVIPKG